HDVLREARLLARIQPVFPLAPRPYVLCDDPTILGVPFYVMERKGGLVLDESFPAGTTIDEPLRSRLSRTAVETLAAIHRIDWRGAGLEGFGHADGFLERQVRGWIDRYARARTDDVPAADQLSRWLADHIPPSPPPTLIHYDFKLNNLMVAEEEPARPVGVLDWEMAAIGDPLLDLAVFLSYWVQPDDPEEMRTLLPTVTAQPGFLERSTLMQLYAAHTGADLSSIHFYLTFARFKLAGIVQQIYARWKRGQTQDERFAGFGPRVRFLIRHATETAEGTLR
ncbi:MAG: phosphotransferase family protein, partial [Chloroflexi bacterium]|nr:phosphotransferase family protein [Chloroflexota bacterium]